MLEALEAFGPAQYLRASFVLYPLLNALHIVAIGVLVTTALLMDFRVLGLGRVISVDLAIRLLRPVAIAGLAVAALSGLTLFAVQPVDYFANPAFRVKMLLLLLAVANAALFSSLRRERQPGFATTTMALLSVGLWLSVLVAGRFIGFMA